MMNILVLGNDESRRGLISAAMTAGFVYATDTCPLELQAGTSLVVMEAGFVSSLQQIHKMNPELPVIIVSAGPLEITDPRVKTVQQEGLSEAVKDFLENRGFQKTEETPRSPPFPVCRDYY